MGFCLGLLADVAAAHGHELSTQVADRDHQSTTLPRSMSSVTESSPSSNIAPRMKEPRPLSAGSAAPMRTPKFTVLEDPVLTGDDNERISRSNSITSSGITPKRGRRSIAASKTSFQLAHPPPAIKHKQRLNIRPKILLQLQQISDATRPVPILDVLPSVIFAPSLARKLPSIFKGKVGLGADDLVIVNSQNYELPYSPDGKVRNVSEDDGWDTRELVAAICQPKKKVAGNEGNTEICLNHGPSWHASSLATGAYEFVSMDESSCKTVARWVPRPPISRRRSYNGQDNSGVPSTDKQRFTFSLINPSMRRHPVIATLNRFSIDVSDRYSVPISTSPNSTPLSSLNQAPSATDVRHAHFKEDQPPTFTIVETDELLRTLIVVTGIWVAFMEGYSPNFKYSKPTVSQAGSNSPRSHKPRHLSLNISSLDNARTASTESSIQEHSFSASPMTQNTSLCSSTPTSPSKSVPQRPQLRRSYSTGTAFLQRANTRRPYLSTKSSQSNATNSSRATDGGKKPCPFRNAQLKHENEVSMIPASSPDDQHIHKAEVSQMPSAAPIIKGAELPIARVLPVTTVTRKTSRINKFFRHIRRASGVH